MGNHMTIKKFLVSGVAALAIASVASVPTAASAQAVSPGGSDDTFAYVALASGIAAGSYVVFSRYSRDISAEASKSKKPVRMASKAPKSSKARKYNWNLTPAQ